MPDATHLARKPVLLRNMEHPLVLSTETPQHPLDQSTRIRVTVFDAQRCIKNNPFVLIILPVKHQKLPPSPSQVT